MSVKRKVTVPVGPPPVDANGTPHQSPSAGSIARGYGPTMSEPEPIVDVIERWHEHLRGRLPGGLDELLHDDVVFFSPIVFTPQEGKAVTKLYLEAAGQALPGEGGGAPVERDEAERPPGAFRYTKKVLSGDTAVLEFETTVEGKYVNGVDIIRCDDAGRIVEFRVMIRPLQAVNAVHQQMARMLELLQQQGE